jgi:ribonuclease BN (tRNA processing enzyme)
VGEHTIIFDAGSGICGFGDLKDYHDNHLRLFLSHYHVDHINGLLFWDSFFNPEVTIDVYGIDDVLKIMGCFLKEPYQPAGVGVFHAKLNYHHISKGETINLGGGVTVKSVYYSHPGGCAGYRIDYEGKSVCYMTDIELAKHKNDVQLDEFVRGTDLLITDTSFGIGEIKKDWGHSNPCECAEFAKRTDVKMLALYHYGFLYTDKQIDEIVESAKSIFTNTIGSTDFMKVQI